MTKNQKSPNKLQNFFIVAFILIVALLLRIYKLDTPLADFHSWRQADTASVARIFTREGFNLFVPRFHDISNVQSSLENPNGYRMVEFPLYNASFAWLSIVIPLFSLEIWGRIVSIVAGLIVTACIYYLVNKEIGRGAAVLSALIFAVLPYSVFFSRVVLPEMTSLALVFIGLVSMYEFEESAGKIRSWLFLFLAGLFCAAGLLTKPTVIFFGVSFLYLFFRKYDIHAFKKIQLYLFGAITLIPLYAWRQHILAFPEGIPMSEWLLTKVNTYEGQRDIFFRPAFFRWIFFERINNIILGGYLSVFFVLGTVVRQRKYFLHSILASSLLYLFTFQGGNVQHEYYQVLILPALAIFTGLGIHFFYTKHKQFISPLLTITVIAGLCIFSLFISWYKVKDFYIYSGDRVTIASIIQSISKPEDKILTDSTGDTTLLYLADRHGSPSVYKDLPLLVEVGYKYFVTQNKEVGDATKEKYGYEVVFDNDKVVIFKLQ